MFEGKILQIIHNQLNFSCQFIFEEKILSIIYNQLNFSSENLNLNMTSRMLAGVSSKKPKLEDNQDSTKGTVSVVCRIRPTFDESPINYTLLPTLNPNKIELFESDEDSNSRCFSFTEIFDQSSTQENLMSSAVVRLFEDLFENCNINIFFNFQEKSGLIFAYGVTNSGKTYTIIGSDQNPGILPNTLYALNSIRKQILRREPKVTLYGQPIKIESRMADINYRLQAFEIYNEEIFDLLDTKRIGKEKIKLNLKEGQDKKYFVKDAFEESFSSDDQVKVLLERCLQNRQIGETLLNINSSRSHTIFRVSIYFKDVISTLCIVDLAGSERSKKADTQGSQLQEACNINKSLLVLGRCLKQMRTHQIDSENALVPYRECKLTKVLSEYFTEENNMLMVVNVRLTQKDCDENLKVLQYGALNVHLNLMKSKVFENTQSFQQRLKEKLAAIKPEQDQTSTLKEDIDKMRQINDLIFDDLKGKLYMQRLQRKLMNESLKQANSQIIFRQIEMPIIEGNEDRELKVVQKQHDKYLKLRQMENYSKVEKIQSKNIWPQKNEIQSIPIPAIKVEKQEIEEIKNIVNDISKMNLKSNERESEEYLLDDNLKIVEVKQIECQFLNESRVEPQKSEQPELSVLEVVSNNQFIPVQNEQTQASIFEEVIEMNEQQNQQSPLSDLLDNLKVEYVIDIPKSSYPNNKSTNTSPLEKLFSQFYLGRNLGDIPEAKKQLGNPPKANVENTHGQQSMQTPEKQELNKPLKYFSSYDEEQSKLLQEREEFRLNVLKNINNDIGQDLGKENSFASSNKKIQSNTKFEREKVLLQSASAKKILTLPMNSIQEKKEEDLESPVLKNQKPQLQSTQHSACSKLDRERTKSDSPKPKAKLQKKKYKKKGRNKNVQCKK